MVDDEQVFEVDSGEDTHMSYVGGCEGYIIVHWGPKF